MNINIQYKRIKHGYVRISREGDLRISIPWRKRFDKRFKNILIEKGKILIQKQQKKNAQILKKPSKMITKEYVWIWGKKHKISEVLQNSPALSLDKYLRKICLEESTQYIDKYSKEIGYAYNAIKVKKVKSRRGSCSGKQNININLALVHLDKKFLKYVAAHEVCHLKYKHHQKTFRALVKKISPSYQIIKKELREEGKILFT